MKTTPTLGLKLYDPWDAPDLVSGYNASMEKLDGAHVMHRRGDLSHMRPDLNSLSETGYYTANGYTFTEENHGPVGSHNIGLLVVYDRCINLNSRACATQQYFPRKDGTGDAYRPMTRALADGVWSAWAPLVDVPDVEGALPANGAAGQVLVKSSASDYDCEWMNPSALKTMVAYDGNTNCLSANGREVAALKMRSIEGLELLNGVQLAPVTITSEEEMKEFLTGATKYGAWVGSGTVSHGKVYGGGPAPCACNAFRQNSVDALNLVITGIAPANLGISTFQIVALGNGVSQNFTLRGIILTYDGGGGAPTQTLINKFSDLSGINLKLSRMANS